MKARALGPIIVVLTLAAGAAAPGFAGQYKWPVITPLHKSFYFADASKAAATVFIHDVDGKPLYRLQCYSQSAPRSQNDPRKDDLYSGGFDCHLYPIPPDGWETLLVDDPLWGAEQYSRGVMGAEELAGLCGEYPEYGRVRHFRLRDMNLVLAYSDISFGSWPPEGPAKIALVRLISFRLSVRAEPDPTAWSTIAEPVPFAEPPPLHTADPNIILPNCSKVIPRHVPGVVTSGYIRREGLGPPYPRVQPAKGAVVFVVRKRNRLGIGEPENSLLAILDRSGKPAYLLHCSASIGEAGLDQWGIGCKLVEVGKKLNLLGDAVDPYSRMNEALITPDQLEGKCWNYPGWGAVRHFRLRGFDLTITVKAAPLAPTKFHRHRGQELPVSFRVKPDPAATSPVAMPSRYIDWRFLYRPDACEHVLVDP